jgi:1-acyl-sn-glycerol-3-phosphate acyltransferase
MPRATVRDPADTDRLRRIEEICFADLGSMSGLAASDLGARVVRSVFGGAVRSFARAIFDFDAAIPRVGVAAAARRISATYGGTLVGEHADDAAYDGPTLFVANHPGVHDTMAVYATSGRPDLRALSRPQPLLIEMPHLHPNLVFVDDEDKVARAAALRACISVLADGGAMVLFAAGTIEPDPATIEPGREVLLDWPEGLGMLVRLAVRRGVPLRVVPIGIHGACSTRTRRWFAPLLGLRPVGQKRSDLAAVLQLLAPRLGPTTVRARYGQPIDAAAIADRPPGEITALLREHVRQLL